MADLTLPVLAGELPSGVCPSTLQEMANAFASIYSVTFPTTFTGITVSSTVPTDTTQAWLRLDSSGRPTRLYYFAAGAWLSLHPQEPGFTMMWTTALPNLNLFDGGSAGVVSVLSGPMWEEVTAMRARFPIGAGTLPSGTVLTVGATAGAETTTLVANNIPGPDIQAWVGSSDGSLSGIREALQTVNSPHAGTSAAYQSSDGVGGNNYVQNPYGDASGNALPFTSLPPYVVMYALRRTGRLYYAV